jgi:RimJ/RimL family protein N-acetyltransferase
MTGLVLETERLLLRDFVEDDWRAVHEYDAHPEVVRFMTWGPNGEQHSRDFVNRNVAASAVTPRTGMQQEGTLRHDALLRDGTWRDHFVFGILADEWQAVR